MKNQVQVLIEGTLESFQLSRREKKLMDMGGLGLPTHKEVVYSNDEYNSGGTLSLLEFKGKIYHMTNWEHFNGNLSNYKENVYQNFGKEVKGMSKEQMNLIEQFNR